MEESPEKVAERERFLNRVFTIALPDAPAAPGFTAELFDREALRQARETGRQHLPPDTAI